MMRPDIVAFHILKEGDRWQGFGSNCEGVVMRLTVDTFESAEAAAKAITRPPDSEDEDDLDGWVITHGPYATVCPKCREKMAKEDD